MAKLSHRLEYLAARVGMGLACSLSPRLADSFGATLGGVFHSLAGKRRAIATDNLKQALGDHLSDDEIRLIVRRVFQNISRTLIEVSRFGLLTHERMREIIIGEGVEHIRRANEVGKGAVFLTAHFGNWELLGQWAGIHGMQIDLLTGTQHNSLIDEMMNKQRRKLGAGVIPLQTSLRGVFKALKANHLIGTAADQHAPAQSLIMDFFGRPASISQGPAAFAVRTGCPILPFLMRRERYDRHVVIAGEPIYAPNSGDDDVDIRDMTARGLKFFENVIARYPDQWMWTHRRWKI